MFDKTGRGGRSWLASPCLQCGEVDRDPRQTAPQEFRNEIGGMGLQEGQRLGPGRGHMDVKPIAPL